MRCKKFSTIAMSAALLIAATGDGPTDPAIDRADPAVERADPAIDRIDPAVEPADPVIDRIDRAVDRNDPGTGSGTLDIRADVDAFDVAGGFMTEFSVRVRDGLGRPVTGAAVTITNTGFGEVTLLDASASGNYVAKRSAFHAGDFTLDIVSGDDVVEGVVLGGPGLHTITGLGVEAPADAGRDLRLRWSVPSQARSAEVETRDYGPLLLPDTGAVIIPGPSNPARADQRIRVFRFNEVDIAGGLFGSRMRVAVRQSIDPLIVE